MGDIEEKLCFVIQPIGQDESETRKRSDKVLEHIIKPILDDVFHYKLVRADGIGETGLITFQIVKHLLEDALVVADLTEANSNVFYELAVRHATGKPVVHLYEKGTSLPFDTKDVRVVEFGFDVAAADKAKKELHQQVEYVQQNDSQTLVSIVLDVIKGRQGRTSETGTADLLLETRDSLNALSAEIRSLSQHTTEIPVKIDGVAARAVNAANRADQAASRMEASAQKIQFEARLFAAPHKQRELHDSLQRLNDKILRKADELRKTLSAERYSEVEGFMSLLQQHDDVLHALEKKDLVK